MQMKIDSLII